MTDAPNNGVPTPPEYNAPAAPQYNAGAAPVPPAYAAAPVATAAPGKTLGIVALVLAFVAAPVGLILGIVALIQSKNAGLKNGMALAAIIIGAIAVVIWIITIIGLVALGNAAVNDPASLLCPSLESGQTYTMDGATFTCP